MAPNQSTSTPGFDDLVPPADQLFDGTSSQAEFVATGAGFTNHFLIQHGGLQPTDRVLDLGSGIGQKARVLSGFLRAEGSYEGLDIVRSGIEWCQKAYRRFPNFHFQVADVYSKLYNASGSFQAKDYRFPFPDNDFAFVFLCSVFTHMLPADMEHYMAEIARVLRPDGRCVISYFLLNPEAEHGIRRGLNSIKAPHVLAAGKCRVADAKCPEVTVAYDEGYVRDLYRQHGLHIAEISYGFWCGRKDIFKCLQDVVIASKIED